MKKNLVIGLASAAAFLFTLWRSLNPRPDPTATMMSGAAPEPFAAVVAGLLAALVVWAVLEFLFAAVEKMRKK